MSCKYWYEIFFTVLWLVENVNHAYQTTKDTQMAIENIPDVKGYATADVCVKHPTKDMWRMCVSQFVCPKYDIHPWFSRCGSVGRADDVIILASGEKTVPAPMESVILSCPLVQGTVMFGRERNQVGVLVEPRPEHFIDVRDDKAVAEFRNRIWYVFAMPMVVQEAC
jgi:hypothetical protein